MKLSRKLKGNIEENQMQHSEDCKYQIVNKYKSIGGNKMTYKYYDRKQPRTCKICEAKLKVEIETIGATQFHTSEDGVFFGPNRCWFCNECWNEILHFVRRHHPECFKINGVCEHEESIC